MKSQTFGSGFQFGTGARSGLAALCLCVALTCSSADARTKYVAEGVIPTPIEVARALAGNQFVPRVKMRGLAVAVAQAPAAAFADSSGAKPSATPHTATNANASPTPPVAGEGSLAIAIPFAFDSARLAPNASPVLDSVAEGIKLLGNGAKIVIEGHTDASGQPGYNLRLSKQRAQSVKRYLVSQHGIAPSTMITVGKGEREPLSGLAPSARENRRVQFAIS